MITGKAYLEARKDIINNAINNYINSFESLIIRNFIKNKIKILQEQNCFYMPDSIRFDILNKLIALNPELFKDI